jgi:organic radical activating enzyme
MAKIKVSELFYSLQGEGRFVGVPSVFLRTYG